MEATGVYWIPLFEILERRGFEVILVNARHALVQMNLQLHNVVTDVTDVSGMKILRAILSGERDPKVLAANRVIHAARVSESLLAEFRPFTFVYASMNARYCPWSFVKSGIERDQDAQRSFAQPRAAFM